MNPHRLRPIAFLVLAAFAGGAAAEEPAVRLRMQPALIPLTPGAQESLPIFLEADKAQGRQDREIEAEGSVRLRKRGQNVSADWLRYEPPTNEVSAEGSVRLEQYGDVLEGSRLRLNLDTDRGFIDDASYSLRIERERRTEPAPAAGSAYAAPRLTLPASSGRGTAARLVFEGEDRYRAEKANFTTCEPGNEDWKLHAGDLTIDQTRNVGTARDASLEFMGTTVLYMPYISFPLKEERKTGFLAPTLLFSGKVGPQVTAPFYWNIAPNYDATFLPSYSEKRGARLGTEFRYLMTGTDGRAFYDWVPNDLADNGRSRYAASFRHSQAFSTSGWGNWSGLVNFQQVSDSNFFKDFSTSVAQTSQGVLPREATVTGSGNWWGNGTWSVNGLYQRWQTLQPDLLNPILPPYDRAPQVTLTASKAELGGLVDAEFLGNYNNFLNSLAALPPGQRYMAYPSLTMPLQTSWGYVMPKLGVNYRQYQFDPDRTTFQNQSITTPVFTLDSGMTFERKSEVFGRNVIQTLEPRAYYNYIPYRDQNRIPNFESTVQDINFATVFTENQFSGYDRINNANALTLGVASRMIEPETGIERLRAVIAQRYYFTPQTVTLPNGAGGIGSSSSDLLAAVGTTLVRHWSADLGWQYSADLKQTQRVSAALRYQPAPNQVANAVYRYNPSQNINQVDLSAIWPLSSRWSAVGRWNYAVDDKRMLEGLAGFEYNAGCWAVRAVAHQFATSTTSSATQFFVQIELAGVARVGAEDLGLLLRRSVPGYASQYVRNSTPEDPLLLR